MSLNAIGPMIGVTTPTAPARPGAGREQDADPRRSRQGPARDAAAARQKAELDEVREKGIYAYAQEKKFEALREKIEKEIKAAKGIDDNSLAAMTPEDRAATMSTLETEIAARIREAMEASLTDQARSAAKDGQPALPMIIDISV